MENQFPPVEQTPSTPPIANENSNRSFWKTIGIGMAIVSFCTAIAAAGYFIVLSKNITTKTACTMEAKLCPDGTSVGRTGPKCEFSPCPTSALTPTPTCMHRPACLDATPRCMIPEPASGWCPIP